MRRVCAKSDTAGGQITQRFPSAYLQPRLPLSEKGKCRSATHPETSLTTSRTKAVLLLRWPFMRETLGLETRGVVFYNIPKNASSASIVCNVSSMGRRRRDPPRGETATETYVALVDADGEAAAGGGFLRHCSFGVSLVDGVRGCCRGGRWAWEGWEVFRGRPVGIWMGSILQSGLNCESCGSRERKVSDPHRDGSAWLLT